MASTPWIQFRSTGNAMTSPLPASPPIYPDGTPIYVHPNDVDPTPEQMSDDLRAIAIAASCRVEQRQWAISMLGCDNLGNLYRTWGEKVGAVTAFRELNTTKTLGQQGYIFRYGGTGKGWPWPTWQKGSPPHNVLDQECHTAMYNLDTGTLVEPYGKVSPATETIEWGLNIFDCSTSPGHLRNMENGTLSAEQNWWSGQASGMPKGAYAISERDIRGAVKSFLASDFNNAYIPHILGTKLYRHTINTFMFPGTKTDNANVWGSGGVVNRLGNGTGYIPMGMIWRLNPAITNAEIFAEADRVGLVGTNRMMFFIIAKTWQKFGMTNTDQTEGGICLIAETVFNTSGTVDTTLMTSYDSRGVTSGPWDYGQTWIRALIAWATDPLARKIQWIKTGRNWEAETGGSATAGDYRPTLSPLSDGGGTTGPTLVNKSLNRPATASSIQDSSYPAGAANDGATGTRWSSAFADNQWWQVDLGASKKVSEVYINWELAYALTGRIKYSQDNITFLDGPVISHTSGLSSGSQGPIATYKFAAEVDARYIKVECYTRNTIYGFSIFEIEVRGIDDAIDNIAPAIPGPTTISNATASTVDLDWSDNVETDFSHYTVQYREGAGAWIKATDVKASATRVGALKPSTAYGFRVAAVDTNGNISNYNTEVTTTTLSNTAGLVEKAQNKSAYASSEESTTYTAARALDADTVTRWGSTWAEAVSFIRVDFGKLSTIERVDLTWAQSYATAYRIQLSNDGMDWTTVAVKTQATGLDVHTTKDTFTPQTGRQLRILCGNVTSGESTNSPEGTAAKSKPENGYSISEILAYGGADPVDPATTPAVSPWHFGGGFASAEVVKPVIALRRGINDAGGEFGTPGPTTATAAFSNNAPGVYDTDYHYDKAGTISYLAGRGLKLIRLPFRYERLFAPDGTVVALERDRITRYLNDAGTAGAQVMLDAHNYGAYYVYDGTQGVRRTVGSAEFTRANFAAMCKAVYATWGTHSAFFGLGLMNEPVDIPESMILSGPEKLANGGFEIDTSDWTATANTTLARSTTRAHTGTAAATLTAVAAGDVSIESTKKAVGIGETIVAEAYASFDGTTARTVGIQLNWFDAAGAYISTSSGRFAADTASFTAYRVKAAAPTVAGGATADATQVNVKVLVQALGASEVHRFDSISMGVGNLITGAQSWEIASREAFEAIRTISTKPVIVGGYFYSTVKNWTTHHPEPWVTGTDVIYEGHYYPDRDNSGHFTNTYAAEVADAEARGFIAGANVDALHTRVKAEIKTFTDWCAAKGVKGFIGETGWPSENHVTAADAEKWAILGETMYAAFNAATLDVTQWVTGEWWNATNENLAYSSASGATGTVDTRLRAGKTVERHITGKPTPAAPVMDAASISAMTASVSFFTGVDVGFPILEYRVTSIPGGLTSLGTSSPLSVSGLTAGTSYTFTVAARNANGWSEESVASNAVVASTVPNAPTIGTATAGDAAASVAFTAPANDGSSTILEYRVTSYPGGITATGTGSPISVTGLTNGTAYTFTVAARNANGWSKESAQSNSVTPQAVVSSELQSNTSVETDLTGYLAGSNTNIDRSTDKAHHGIASLKLTAVAAGVAKAEAPLVSNLTPGKKYTASCYVSSASTVRPCGLQMNWFDEAGNYLTTHSSPYVTTTTDWAQRTMESTAPANATRVRVSPVFDQVAAAESHYADLFSFKEAISPSGTVLFTGDYDTGDFSQWSGIQAPSNRQPTIVNDPDSVASHFQTKFENSTDDATDLVPPFGTIITTQGTNLNNRGTIRTDVPGGVSPKAARYRLVAADGVENTRIQNQPTFKPKAGSNHWYAFAVHIGLDWNITEAQFTKDGSRFALLNAITQSGSGPGGGVGTKWDSSKSTPQRYISARGTNETWADGLGEDHKDLGPFIKDQWTYFAYRIRWTTSSSTSSDPNAEYWRKDGIDGTWKLVATRTAATLADGTDVEWRLGLYEGKAINHTRTLWYDNVAIGDTFGQVDPSHTAINKVGRFELQANDDSTLEGVDHRSEVFKSGTGYKFAIGDERWFKFRINLASTFAASTQWGNGNQHLVQWKNDGSGSPPVDLRILEDGRVALVDRRSFNFTTGLKIYWGSPPLSEAGMTDSWLNFIVGIYFHDDPAKGWIELDYARNAPPSRQTLLLPRRDPPEFTRSADGYRIYTQTSRPPGDGRDLHYIKQGYYSGADMTFAGVILHDGMKYGTTKASVA